MDNVEIDENSITLTTLTILQVVTINIMVPFSLIAGSCLFYLLRVYVRNKTGLKRP